MFGKHEDHSQRRATNEGGGSSDATTRLTEWKATALQRSLCCIINDRSISDMPTGLDGKKSCDGGQGVGLVSSHDHLTESTRISTQTSTCWSFGLGLWLGFQANDRSRYIGPLVTRPISKRESTEVDSQQLPPRRNRSNGPRRSTICATRGT